MKHVLAPIFTILGMLGVFIFIPITKAYANVEEGWAAYQTEDYVLAFQQFTLAARLGDPHAQYNVGLMHIFGHGITEDYSEAAKWFGKAAAQGLPEAQNALGAMFARARWPEEAVRQFQAAAEQGDALAQYNLASMYASGHGTAADPIRAQHWRSLALHQGLELGGTFNLEVLSREAITGHHIRSVPFDTSLPVIREQVASPRFVKIGRDGSTLAVQTGIWNDRGNEQLGSKWSCVIDTTTDLMWEVKHRENRNDTFLFASAAGHARSASICGANDWRLPTREELLSVVDRESTQPPAIDTTIFPQVQAGFYWSSEVDPRRTDQAFGVTFSHGRVVTANQASRSRVMLVRRAQ